MTNSIALFPLEAASNKRIGAKANNLCKLAKVGLPVPEAFISVTQPIVDLRRLLKGSDFSANIRTLVERWIDKDRIPVAIRSSAEIEDSKTSSFAGLFNSFVGEHTWCHIETALSRFLDFEHELIPDDAEVAVLIQRYVKPAQAGVTFTADPLTGFRQELLTEQISGSLNQILEQGKSGTFVRTARSDGQLVGESRQLDAPLISRVHAMALEIEEVLQFPVDIEWLIDGSEKLWVVQARPIVFPSTSVVQINSEAVSDLPKVIETSPKIQLRLLGAVNGVDVSPAWAVIARRTQVEQVVRGLGNIGQSEFYAGFSTVVIHPSRVKGNVQRSFVGNCSVLENAIKNCKRYAVRDYPPFSDLKTCVTSLAQMATEEHEFCGIIIQEIYRAAYTGMIQQIQTGYIVEVAAGHFVPKGVVPVSKYIFDNSGMIKSMDREVQENCFDIIDGAVLNCTLDPPYEGIELDEACGIVDAFSKLLVPGRVVEFGRTIGSPQTKGKFYLIDYGDDDSSNGISTNEIAEGVISVGHIAGRVIRVDAGNPSALHTHLGDDQVTKGQNVKEPIVYVARYPSIELARLIDPAEKGVSFIFERGSALCHLALLLRERGIPAKISIEAQKLIDGQRIGSHEDGC